MSPIRGVGSADYAAEAVTVIYGLPRNPEFLKGLFSSAFLI